MHKPSVLLALPIMSLSACMSTVDTPTPGTVIGTRTATPVVTSSAHQTYKTASVATPAPSTPAASTSDVRKPVKITEAPTYTGSGTTRDPVVVNLYD